MVELQMGRIYLQTARRRGPSPAAQPLDVRRVWHGEMVNERKAFILVGKGSRKVWIMATLI